MSEKAAEENKIKRVHVTLENMENFWKKFFKVYAEKVKPYEELHSSATVMSSHALSSHLEKK